MTRFRTFWLVILPLALSFIQTTAYAVTDFYQQQQQNQQLLRRQNELRESMKTDRYIRQVGEKAVNGLANIVTGPLELPKSIINKYNYTYNQQPSILYFPDEPDNNLIYGVVGGIIGGMIHSTARIMTGVGDLVTAPLPTKPSLQPKYIWDDFDRTNSYGQVFRLHDNPPIEPYVAPPPRPVAQVQPAPVYDLSQQYNDQTNRNLDTMFRKEMQK